jgi:hypothetical protein
MRLRKTILILAGICFCLSSAFDFLIAQESGAILSGTISNGSGQAVVKAKVTARNTSTGESTETLSDSAGKYRLASLALGNYAVSVQLDGYETKISNISIASVVRKRSTLS